MRYCGPKNKTPIKKVLENKEISKGTLGSVVRCPYDTIFTFFKTTIDKRKKLKDEMNSIIQSYKDHPIKEGILKIKSINSYGTSYIIITEPVIDSLSNIYDSKFKGFEIFKMFNKFNVFIKYCLDNKIDLSNLKLSDIYLTKNHELKLLTIKYDTEILHKIKKEKFSDINNNKSKNNIIYILGIIMYYLYYNEYPKKNETRFPEQKHFKELLKYCLNLNTKYNFNEYFNKTFFHPDIIFPNSTKENIILFNKYIEYKPNKGYISPETEELYWEKKVKVEEFYETYYCIYNSFDKSKICEGKDSENSFRLFRLKAEQNKNIYIIIFYHYRGYTACILKKNSNNSFSLIQEIKSYIYSFLELSTGDIAISDKKRIIIYHKNSGDKFDIRLILNIPAISLNETEDNYLRVRCEDHSILYDIKSFKIIKEIKDIDESHSIYINEKMRVKNRDKTAVIFHDFFEEDIFNFDDIIYCLTKKKDGTYLAGGRKNNIYQIYFDKYGFVELLDKVDSGYGIKEDDCKGDCIYSCGPGEYYSVDYIEECQNGNILTISKVDDVRKVWKLGN